MMNCPECGAPDMTCESHFHACLAKEYEDADYGAVHHLLVATYMLQHSSKLTREGWLFERELLREFLIEKKSPELIRKQNKDVVDSGKRDFKIAARDDQPVIDKTTWARTILNVHLENANVYCEEVTAWAKSAFEEAQGLEV